MKGYEVGETGTRHLQGYVEFTRSCRLCNVRTILRDAFWQGANGSSLQNFKYCTISKNYETIGDFSKEIVYCAVNQPVPPISIPLIIKGLMNSKTAGQTKLSKEYAEKHNFFDKVTENLKALKDHHELFAKWKKVLLYPWQFQCLCKVMDQGPREVLWVVGREGDDGKTFLSNVLNILYNFILLDGTISTRDLAQLIKGNVNGFCFDISRAAINSFDYSTLEAVKNGYIVSGKYGGRIQRFKDAPVLVFSNSFPNSTLLSADRWNMVVLGEGEFKDISKIPIVSPSPRFPFIEPPDFPDFSENFDFHRYSKTSLNRTQLFQKVVRFSKISVYTKCRIAPANRTKFGLGGGFSDVSDRSSKPSEVRISARAVERDDTSK